MVLIPRLLADSVKVLQSVSLLPLRSADKEVLVTGKYIKNVEKLDQQLSGTFEGHDSHFDDQIDDNRDMCPSSADLSLGGISEEMTYEGNGTMMNGKSFTIAVNVINVSVALLMYGSDLDEGTMELNVQRAALAVSSCSELENLSIAINRTTMTACRLYPHMTEMQGLQIYSLPLKEAFLMENAQVLYTGESPTEKVKLEEITNLSTALNGQNSTKNEGAGIGHSNHSFQLFCGTVKIRSNVTVAKIVINLAPTFIVVLSGFAEVSLNKHLER